MGSSSTLGGTPIPALPINPPSNGTVTPPQGSFTQGDQPNVSGQDPTAIIKMLMSLAQKQKQMPQPVPAPIPQGGQGIPGYEQPSKNWGPAWSGERLMSSIGSSIQTAVSQHKQQQVARATADWNTLTAGMQSGNQTLVNSILQDPKKLKSMAKALNSDWLNPEKTDVYQEALKSHLQEQQKKGVAAQGLMATFKQLIQKVQGQGTPQMTPEQLQQMGQQIQAKAPTVTPPDDLKSIIPVVTEQMKADSAQKIEADKENYNEFKTEQTQAHQDWRQQTQQQFTERMDRLRETAQEQRQASSQEAMFKALGIRLSDEDRRKMEIAPSQINTEINSSLTSMRQQLTQAASQLKTMQTQAAKRNSSLWQRVISDSPDVKGAQSQVDNQRAAIDYIEKNRAQVIAGKQSLDDVIDQAQSIASGTPPGFK